MEPFNSIREMIDGSAQATWWGKSRSILVERYVLQFDSLGAGEVEDALLFVDQYVRAAPDLLEKLSLAAKASGLQCELAPLIDAVVTYWKNEDDLLPDRLGLIGLADDAYISFRLIERFAEAYRELSEQELFPHNLPQANRTMAQLLGPDLTAALEDEVDAVFERAELHRSLQGLAGWRGQFGIDGALPSGDEVPDAPVLSVAESVVRALDGGPAEEPTFTRWEIRRGNLSLLSLGLAVGLLFVWQLYFRFPMSADVRILGFDGIKLAWISSIQTFVLGSLGLSTILAASNLKNLIANFYKPFEQLRGAELKSFYAARGTAFFSVLVLVLFVVVCFSNVTVRLGVDPRTLDLVSRVDGGRDVFFVTYPANAGPEPPTVSDEVRLGGPDDVRIVLRGTGAEALLLVRDKYNLTTVDALWVERRPFGVAYRKADLEVHAPKTVTPSEQKLLGSSPTGVELARSFGATRFTLDLREPFRFEKMLPNRITGESGSGYGPRGDGHHLYIVPVDSSPCPGQAPRRSSEIQLFWNEICDRRDTLAAWARTSSFFDVPEVGMTAVDLPNHRVEVMFVRGEVSVPEHPPARRTREAVRLVGIHRKWLEKETSDLTKQSGVASEEGPEEDAAEPEAD